MKRTKILLTNDDGIHAPGLRVLWEALKRADFADLCIVAPTSERSGAGVSITWDRPLLIQEINHFEGTPAWCVDGSPADCVKLGMRIILEHPPDFIASGINAGSNAGRNVLHSGTVGAVIEGVFRGIPGVAFSCENGRDPNFHVAEKYVATIVKYLLENPLAHGTLLNVNFPKVAKEKVKGFRLTKQGRGRWSEDPLLHLESEKGRSYWLGGKPDELPEDQDCDIALLKEGYMTAVPLYVHNLTDQEEWEKRGSSFQELLE